MHDLPLWRTSWRRIKRRPFQYILFILGVAIGVAMMVSIDLANGSATRAFALSTDAVTGKATHRLIGGGETLDEQIYINLRRQLGYQTAAPVVEGYVSAVDMGNTPLRLVGLDPFAEPPFRSYLASDTAADGPLTAFLTQPNSIIISANAAERYGLALGQPLTLDVAGEQRTMTIVGLLASDDSGDALNDLLLADVSTAQEVLGLGGRLSHIDLIIETPTQLAEVEAFLPTGVRLESTAASLNSIQQMTAAFELNLTALSLLALVVGMFLIYNTVTFSVVQRRPMFGILRCLGVTGQQLFRLIMAEAVLLSLVGSALGLVLGVLLGRGLVGLITQTINDFYFVVNVRDVAVPPWSLAKGVIFGVTAAILASLPPALEARNTPPNTGLRRSVLESKVTKLLPYLLVGWLVLGLIGVGLLAVGGGLVPAFAGLFAILFAFALLTPPATVWLMRALVRPLGALAGAIGRMAPRDIVRSLSRTSIAIAALMTAVSVIVGVSIMIGSFRQTVVDWLNATLQADIYISPPTLTASRVDGALQDEVVAELLAWPGIASASTARTVRVQVPAFGREVGLVAVSGDMTEGQRPTVWTSAAEGDVWAQVLRGEGIIISEPLLIKENLGIPPAPLTLLTNAGEQTFPVLAVFYDYASDQGTIWMGREAYVAGWGDEATSTVALYMAEGVDVEAVVAAMQAQFAGRQDLIVRSNQSLRQNSLEIFDRTFAITAALRLLATIVAFIGVLSALMSLQLERSRELGMLRATGMTIGQLWRLTLLETGLMGGVAGVLAMPTGYALAWVLIYVINVRSFGWTLQMYLQPSYFLQAFAVALTAALLAAIYPSFRLGQMVIATAVRSE
ncbi:MAG: FtsX-like permease family protein [Chloroflexi bacterium]|nr:FtsX-like permease family protein [Chloroflexota bacterium]